ncbi:hypothetical protein A2U01_0002997 [Trifolium medium]|uniref:Uncharacterized protein n=1 Tax=Trifolium medium TaxID=97028 RepID=A0A392M466_9FABA|nr:hypothetical protein [Trifolium medium]
MPAIESRVTKFSTKLTLQIRVPTSTTATTAAMTASKGVEGLQAALDVPVAPAAIEAQAQVPGQGDPPIEAQAQFPGQAAPQGQINAAFNAVAPNVQHQDADDADIDTTLSLAPPAQRRRLI